MIAPLAVLASLHKIELRAVAEANAAAFRSAILRHDATWFERTFAPDFVQRTEAGGLDRKVALAQITGGLLRMRATHLSVKVASVRAEGKGYVATVVWQGSEPATLMNRPASLDVSWRDDQRWIRTNGRWLLRSLTTSHFERTIE